MWAVNDVHPAECQIGILKVGIGCEVAYPKNVSRLRVDGYGRSNDHSNRLDELRKSSPDHNSKSSKPGKRRAKITGESVFLKTDIPIVKSYYTHVKEREILHKISVFREKLTGAHKSFSHNESFVSARLCVQHLYFYIPFEAS